MRLYYGTPKATCDPVHKTCKAEYDQDDLEGGVHRLDKQIIRRNEPDQE